LDWIEQKSLGAEDGIFWISEKVSFVGSNSRFVPLLEQT